MEESKKRKLEASSNGENSSVDSERHLRSLLDSLAKTQLVDLLTKLGSQYPSIAEEIKSLASADPAHRKADPAHRKLFVRGLGWNTTSESLCAAFQVHGEIEEGVVIFDKATGKSRGYGFITYKDVGSAQLALEAPGKIIDGQMAACNLASESLSRTSIPPDQGQRKLYIGGLSPDTTTEMLLLFFGRHGEIEEGSVAYDKDTNRSRGFGFITYKTAEAARNAIDDPQKILGARSLIVKLADNNKSKMGQPQQTSSTVQVPFPLASGYDGNPYSSPASVAYTYPFPVAPFPSTAAAYPSYPNTTAYPNPSFPNTAAYPNPSFPNTAAYPNPPLAAVSASHPNQLQMPYSGMTGYQYYTAQQ